MPVLVLRELPLPKRVPFGSCFGIGAGVKVFSFATLGFQVPNLVFANRDVVGSSACGLYSRLLGRARRAGS
jgi:hypothetical protein